MELHLDPIIPMLRKGPDGRPRFNKGYHSPNKGKTYVEIFGEERAREIIAKRSEKLKDILTIVPEWHMPSLALLSSRAGLSPGSRRSSTHRVHWESPTPEYAGGWTVRSSQEMAGNSSTRTSLINGVT